MRCIYFAMSYSVIYCCVVYSCVRNYYVMCGCVTYSCVMCCVMYCYVRFLYMMDPRMYWLILLFVRNSEDLFLTAVGKNTFRKEICVRILVSFFSSMMFWKIYRGYVMVGNRLKNIFSIL